MTSVGETRANRRQQGSSSNSATIAIAYRRRTSASKLRSEMRRIRTVLSGFDGASPRPTVPKQHLNPRHRSRHLHLRPSPCTVKSAPHPLLSPLKKVQRSTGFGLKAPKDRHHDGNSGTRQASSFSIGSEPGFDLDGEIPPTQDGIGIKIVDYSAERVEQQEVPSSSIAKFLEADKNKPDWAAARWIYVNGIDRDVVHTLGQAYDLHPLTLEDVMNTDNLSKADWYDDHCFLELTLQKLVDVVENKQPAQKIGATAAPGVHKKRFTYAATSNDADVVEQLDKPGRHLYQRFNMSVEQVSVYLTSSNTVITIFERSGEDIFKPIYNRLQSPHTILRSSNDASMLVQGVVDAVVDLASPVGRAFEDAFTELELAVLTKPSITLSRQVYVLRAGLASFLDLLVPIGGLVRALTDHRNPPQHTPGAGPIPTSSSGSTPDFASQAVSPLTQAYLKDVQDHLTTLTSSTHMRIRSAENLTSLIFNTIAAKQNESVRQLTLVSIFFLPLTFLTGYFGMNFDPMPIVQEHSDEIFWFIASPVMGVTLAILMARPAARKISEWRRLSSRRRRR